MATSPTQWLGGTEAHIIDLMLSKLRAHLGSVLVNDATGTIHQVKATGKKELARAWAQNMSLQHYWQDVPRNGVCTMDSEIG